MTIPSTQPCDNPTSAHLPPMSQATHSWPILRMCTTPAFPDSTQKQGQTCPSEPQPDTWYADAIGDRELEPCRNLDFGHRMHILGAYKLSQAGCTAGLDDELAYMKIASKGSLDPESRCCYRGFPD